MGAPSRERKVDKIKPEKSKGNEPPRCLENVEEFLLDNPSFQRNLDTEKPELPYRKCSVLLRDRILERRQQKITDETLEKWDREVRLMRQRDNRTVEDILALINECHDMEPRPGGDFTWRDNILSMEALRKRWNEGKIYIGMNSNQVTKRFGKREFTYEDLIEQRRFLSER
jgi:hypothetical protein